MDDTDETNDSDCVSTASHKIKNTTKKYNKEDFIKTKAFKAKEKNKKHKTIMKDNISAGKKSSQCTGKIEMELGKDEVMTTHEEFLSLPTMEVLLNKTQITPEIHNLTIPNISSDTLIKGPSYNNEMGIEAGQFFQFPKKVVPLKNIIEKINKEIIVTNNR